MIQFVQIEINFIMDAYDTLFIQINLFIKNHHQDMTKISFIINSYSLSLITTMDTYYMTV